MKILYKLLCVAILPLLVIAGCKKEQHGDIVYITGTDVTPLSNITAEDDKVSSVAISISSSGLANGDINADFKADPDLVAAYNKANNKNYLPVPEGDYELVGSNVTIKAGTSVSNSVELHIKSIKNFKPGSSYMMAVTVANETGGFKVLESSRTIYYVIKPVIITTVASLTNNFFTPSFTEANSSGLKSLSTITLEARIFVKNFQSRSPYISSVMGIEEHFLLRFGDVTIKPDQLQLAGMGVVTAPQSFATGTWYHIALVHEPASNKLYVNGVLVASGPGSNNINFLQPLGSGAYSTGFLIGSSAGSRYLDGLISECRVWTRALSQTEIVDGMCGVDPSSPGLEAYWKFNEGTGNIAKDISGHGHDATASRTVDWVPNVRCE